MFNKKLIIFSIIFLLVVPLVLATPGSLTASTNRAINNQEHPQVFDPIGTLCTTIDPNSPNAPPPQFKHRPQDRIGSAGEGMKHCYVTDLLEEYNDLNYIKGKGKGLGFVRECTPGTEDFEFYNQPSEYKDPISKEIIYNRRGYEFEHTECESHSGSGDPRAFCGDDYKCHYCDEETQGNPTCAIKAPGYYPGHPNPSSISNACIKGDYNGQIKSCYFCAPIQGSGDTKVNIIVLNSDKTGKDVVDLINNIQPYEYLSNAKNSFTFREVKSERNSFDDVFKIPTVPNIQTVNAQKIYDPVGEFMKEVCGDGINIVVDGKLDSLARPGVTERENDCRLKQLVTGTDRLVLTHEFGHAFCELADEYEGPNKCSFKAINLDFGYQSGGLICPNFKPYLEDFYSQGGQYCFDIGLDGLPDSNPLKPTPPFISSQSSLMGVTSIGHNIMGCIGCITKANTDRTPEEIKATCYDMARRNMLAS